MKKKELKKKSWVYDTETLPNLHSCVFIDRDSSDQRIFVIHESRDERAEYFRFLKEECSELIGFNNVNYDYPLIHYFMSIMEEVDNIEVNKLTELLFKKSTYLIEKAKFPSIPFYNVLIPQVDLFKIYHLNNKARICGLKFIQISLGWHNVLDMPYHHTHFVEKDEIDSLLKYNINDVESTKFFYEYAVEGGEIEKRKVLGELYGKDFTNYSDVGIGDYINLKAYCDVTGKDQRIVRKYRTQRDSIDLKDCILDNVSFKTEYLQVFLEQLRKVTITSTKGEYEHHLHFANKEFHMKTGGLHSVDSPKIVIPADNEELCELDVGSMYPSIICAYNYFPKHLGKEFIESYNNLRIRRLKAKKLKKESSLEAYLEKGLKLSLNGLYGKTNDKYSWVYDPLVTMKVTITGQLFLLMLIEQCHLAGFKIISANTDGIYVISKKSERDKLDSLVKAWMETTKLVLERVGFKKLVLSNVNNYIALPDYGGTKLKGWFEITKPPYKKHTMEVVKQAWFNYYVNDISIEETIYNCKDIYKFCIPSKMKKGWTSSFSYYDGEKEAKEMLQKTNRYFISNDGGILLKNNKDGRVSEIEKGYYVTLLNKIEEKDANEYDINYDYYIKEAYRVINELESNSNQLTLI